MRRLLVLDDFFADPLAVRKAALAQHFFGSATKESLTLTMSGVIVNTLAQAGVLAVGQLIQGKSTFRVAYAGDPCLHAWGDRGFCMEVFLTPDAPLDGGLTLFRSRRSQARSVEELRSLEALSDTVDGTHYDRTAWEPVDQVGNVFNRAVVWDARSFAAMTNPFGMDHATARLVQHCAFDVHQVQLPEAFEHTSP